MKLSEDGSSGGSRGVAWWAEEEKVQDGRVQVFSCSYPAPEPGPLLFPLLSLTFPSFLAAFPTLSRTTHGPHLPRRVLDIRTL
jgi:hypothetical protein